METSKLKKFAQYARRSLIEQVSAKLKLVLTEGSAARRENPKAVKSLEEQIKASSEAQVIEKMAYIWFNRFCALHYMDVNRYTRISVVSPAEGQFQPEILAEAKMGHIDEDMVPEKTRQQIFALLNGTAPSRDPQAEAYRLLVVAACNDYYTAMPYLFERIEDYTELLMPDDLLSGNSILAYTREAMTPDVCRDVEVIGWLYQFYISEKKDEVINRRSVVPKEEIPFATQLFTPKWIVKYMVENSLGRLWMLNRPNSRLVERMDYYISPDQTEMDFLRIAKPEELKICDPACGSGHILSYAFDLLYAMYEEEGYEPSVIPEKILTHNLYGIEIDERAGELAAFALTMKARAKHRRFFSKPVQPNICVLENIQFDENELKNYMNFVGLDLFTANLQITLHQFEEADNFGSLIRPAVTDVDSILRLLESKDVSGHLFLSSTHQKVIQALKQADYLSPKYHVVIANPPYMGGKGMNGRLKAFLNNKYADVKSDLFSAFIVRNSELTLPKGELGFVTPYVWMFISSYEKLRSYVLENMTITSLVQLEYNAFAPACIPVATFTISNINKPDFKGSYVRLSDFRGAENQGPKALEAIKNPECGWFYYASAANFKKIPGSPIAYWVSDKVRTIFDTFPPMSDSAPTKQGLATGDNDRFLRYWYEAQISSIGFKYPDRNAAAESDLKWFPCNKGGEFRKWFGNNYFVVNWHRDGEEIKAFFDDNGKLRSRPQNQNFYFRKGLTWSAISSSYLSMRYSPQGHMFETKGAMCFPRNDEVLYSVLGFCNSKLVNNFLKAISPTLDFHEGPVGNLPFRYEGGVYENVKNSICLSKLDWDAYETSWDFTSLPLLHPDYRQPTLKATYQRLRTHWQEMTREIQRLEEENNRIFIEAYGLQDELPPEVPLKEITLTCNPHYRYSDKKSEEELEALLLADTMKEFISYAVGCMFGRYSLDKPGLILANQGETTEDYYRKIGTTEYTTEHTEYTERDRRDFFSESPVSSAPSVSSVLSVSSVSSVVKFPPDDNNAIPILDGDWFPDDISERFRKFLRVTFGDEHYEENLNFIEKAIGKDIRKYFLKDFYSDHVRRYKKRPIYWLFSSPKGSFNALIYMHRYRPDTVSVVLNDYLREFRTKLSSRVDHLKRIEAGADTSQTEKTKALKEIEKLNKMIKELEDYEREVLYPLATEQVEIDLDDGVKVNYSKFGAALKKIPGMDAKED